MAKQQLARVHDRSDRHRTDFNIQFPPLNGMFGSHRVEKSVHKAALSAKNCDEERSKLWNFKGKKHEKNALMFSNTFQWCDKIENIIMTHQRRNVP